MSGDDREAVRGSEGESDDERTHLTPPGRVGRTLARIRAIAELSVGQIRHKRGRTALVVVAIALAVLAVTLLAGLGIGVLETGEERFEEAERDLWLSGKSVGLTATGQMENPIVGAHEIADTLAERPDVRGAQPLAFHSVYVGPNADDLEVVTGVGIPGTHDELTLESGEGFSGRESHYADGTYDGPTTDEIVVDPETAELLDVGVGDDLVVGSSAETADDYTVTVVGISGDYASFLGTSTVTMPLSELQRVAGTTGSDRATFVTISVAEDASVGTVREDLQEAYPEYDVQTNEEQLEAVLEGHALVIASGTTLVVLAVLAGIALTVNLLALVASHQRTQLAALGAIGVSRGVLAGIVGGQGIVLGVLGGSLGLLVTPVFAVGLNRIATSIVGFENLLRTPLEVYVLGGAIAVLVGTLAAVVGGWRAGRYATVGNLDQ